MLMPLWWRDPPEDTFGGLLTADARKYRKNISRDYTETHCKLRAGQLNDWETYTAKWLGSGGALLSWYIHGQSRQLDLASNRPKIFIITYNIDTLTNRMYLVLKEMIRQIDTRVVEKKFMFWRLAQCSNTEYEGNKTVGVITAAYHNAEVAILNLRKRLRGFKDVVTKNDTIFSITRKDGINS